MRAQGVPPWKPTGKHQSHQPWSHKTTRDGTEGSRDLPSSALATSSAPFHRRGLQHQTSNEIRMSSRQEHRNRPTHRIADGDHSLCAECAGNGGGIVSTVFEAEGFVGSQSAAVTAMVDANHGRKLTEFVIGGEEVEVA
jgi:hypothetical protein